MYLFHDLKLIYIIVPGTGSNSFHGSLKRKFNHWERVRVNGNHPAWDIDTNIRNAAHFTARQAKLMIEPRTWAHYKKISFVRDPYDWVTSIYNKGGLLNSIGEDNTIPFHTFIKNLKITPYFWFTDNDGEVIVDKIYRIEGLNTEIFEEFNCAQLYENKSTGKKYPFSDDDKEIIQRKFKREFIHYDR